MDPTLHWDHHYSLSWNPELPQTPIQTYEHLEEFETVPAEKHNRFLIHIKQNLLPEHTWSALGLTTSLISSKKDMTTSGDAAIVECKANSA